MCGRYWLEAYDDEDIVSVSGAKRSGEILPGDIIPALCFSRAGNVRSFAMKWGWHLSGGKLLINTRSENVEAKEMFSDSVLHRRCLLPMSSYFEWHKRGKDKIKYRIYPERSEKCYLAALYRWEDDVPVVSVLTRAASEEIAFIHDRMPVIISQSASKNWLASKELIIPEPITMNYSIAI